MPSARAAADAVRHDALAASLVDGRFRAIREGHIETAAARGDGRGQSSGPAADHEHIGDARESGHQRLSPSEAASAKSS